MPYDPASNPLNSQEWIFPFLEVVHIGCLAMSVGLISVINLKLIGTALPKTSAPELNKKLFLWMLAGLSIVLLAGMMLFTTDPLRYYYNPGFRFKMWALLFALVYQFTVHNTVINRKQEGSDVARVSAAVSTISWVSVVFGGIFYAFV